jgi:hypothetical protein
MKLLLDQGLPRSTVSYLMKQKISCIHVAEVGLADASDAVILTTLEKKGASSSLWTRIFILCWLSPAPHFLRSFVSASRDFGLRSWPNC